MANARSVVTVVTVTGVEPVSPTFVRVELADPALADFGVDGPVYDQRIKLIFPPESGRLPSLDGDDWYADWLALPEEERGAMRTYSIRDLYGEGADRRLVVDFVLHLEPGATGPASRWASRAGVGDQVIVVGPRRSAATFGGIEFAPGSAGRVLLAGDETAVPAMTRILADLPTGTVGDAFLEVPTAADILPIAAPAGVTLRWLPRDGGGVGAALVPTLLAHLGSPASASIVEEDVEDNVWETPTFSGSGEELEGVEAVGVEAVGGLYAWIAGESAVVTAIRRHLVTEVGLDRSQVAFMGYWRKGVAMRG